MRWKQSLLNLSHSHLTFNFISLNRVDSDKNRHIATRLQLDLLEFTGLNKRQLSQSDCVLVPDSLEVLLAHRSLVVLR